MVAGLRSRRGASFRLLEAIGSGRFGRALSTPLVLEYEDVLSRHSEATGLTAENLGESLDFVCSVSRCQAIDYLWRPCLRDPKDDMVFEIAVAAGCEGIVTFNARDFAGVDRFGLLGPHSRGVPRLARSDFMSTLSIHLPESLHKQLQELARSEGVSIDQLISAAASEKVSALMTEEYLKARAARGDRAAFDRVLAKVRDVGPEIEDRIDPPMVAD